MSAKDEKAAPANKLDTMKRAVHDFLHEKNAFTSVFEMVEKYTKIQREYFFLGELIDSRGGGSVCGRGS